MYKLSSLNSIQKNSSANAPPIDICLISLNEYCFGSSTRVDSGILNVSSCLFVVSVTDVSPIRYNPSRVSNRAVYEQSDAET